MNNDEQYEMPDAEDDDRMAFHAEWIDHFWGHSTKGFVYADSLEEAIERGLRHDADGLPIDSLLGKEGSINNLSGGHQVCAARVLVEVDGVLHEDTIAALTLDMAIDLAEAMNEPYGQVMGIEESGNVHWVVHPDPEFFTREDLPAGWAKRRC
jgi:hypothetical protein